MREKRVYRVTGQWVYWKGVQARVSSILPSLSLSVSLSSSCISAQAARRASARAACCRCTSSDTASLGRGFFTWDTSACQQRSYLNELLLTNIFIFLSLFIFWSGFCLCNSALSCMISWSNIEEDTQNTILQYMPYLKSMNCIYCLHNILSWWVSKIRNVPNIFSYLYYCDLRVTVL